MYWPVIKLFFWFKIKLLHTLKTPYFPYLLYLSTNYNVDFIGELCGYNMWLDNIHKPGKDTPLS